MFRYERVNSTRKFTIVAEIVSLLKKIYKRYAPFRAVFKVKTLAVMFPPYPREMKTNTAKFKSAARHFVQPIPTRALSQMSGLSMRTHLTVVEPWARLHAAVPERSLGSFSERRPDLSERRKNGAQ